MVQVTVLSSFLPFSCAICFLPPQTRLDWKRICLRLLFPSWLASSTHRSTVLTSPRRTLQFDVRTYPVLEPRCFTFVVCACSQCHGVVQTRFDDSRGCSSAGAASEDGVRAITDEHHRAHA